MYGVGLGRGQHVYVDVIGGLALLPVAVRAGTPDPTRAPRSGRDEAMRLRDAINRAERPEEQLALLDDYLDHADDRIPVHAVH